MKKDIFYCDECQAVQDGKASITLLGNWASAKAGILLPRYEYHFCGKACLLKWLESAKLQ